jgi:hypothetical protein
MRDDGVLTLWLGVELALWVGGGIAWVIGMALQWRLIRRFVQKTGSDSYGLRNLAERYSVQSWMWLLEFPQVAWKIGTGTTPLADIELEAMRRTFRRWITAGGLCIVAAVAWFLAPVVWLLVTHW